MQFKFSALTSAIIAAIHFAGIACAGTIQLRDGEIATHDQILAWIATTDARLTFIGEPLDTVASSNTTMKRNTANTMVVYCTTRTLQLCGGDCTVYNGNNACLAAPNTNCLSATTNVAFCSQSGCKTPCNEFSSCGDKLDNNFCYTPATESINVPFT